MGSSKIEAPLVDLPRDQWDAWGPHTCEFLYAAGEGMKPQRLQKIASGGEMSRIMLALKVVLGSSDTVDTLVFDEIDAGWEALRHVLLLKCWPILHRHIKLLS